MFSGKSCVSEHWGETRLIYLHLLDHVEKKSEPCAGCVQKKKRSNVMHLLYTTTGGKEPKNHTHAPRTHTHTFSNAYDVLLL